MILGLFRPFAFILVPSSIVGIILLAHSLQQLKPLWRWQITPSGRIAHRKEYVEEIAEAHSFDVVLYEKLDNFREEKGVVSSIIVGLC